MLEKAVQHRNTAHTHHAYAARHPEAARRHQAGRRGKAIRGRCGRAYGHTLQLRED